MYTPTTEQLEGREQYLDGHRKLVMTLLYNGQHIRTMTGPAHYCGEGWDPYEWTDTVYDHLWSNLDDVVPTGAYLGSEDSHKFVVSVERKLLALMEQMAHSSDHIVAGLVREDGPFALVLHNRNLTNREWKELDDYFAEQAASL